MIMTDVDYSYAADAAIEAAEAVIGVRDWIADEAARAELAEMARALVGLAREQAAAAGPEYYTPGLLARRLAAVEAAAGG